MPYSVGVLIVVALCVGSFVLEGVLTERWARWYRNLLAKREKNPAPDPDAKWPKS